MLHKFARGYQKFAEIFITALFVLAFVVVLLQAVSRYVFNKPFIWTDEASTVFQLILAFLGTAYGTRRKSHIRVDGLFKKLPAVLQELITLAFSILLIAICVVFVDKGLQYALRNWTINFGTFAVGNGKALLCVPIGFALTAVYSVMDAVDALLRLCGKQAVFFKEVDET